MMTLLGILLYISWVGLGLIPILIEKRKLIRILTYAIEKEKITLSEVVKIEDNLMPNWSLIFSFIFGPFTIFFRFWYISDFVDLSYNYNTTRKLSRHVGYNQAHSRYGKIIKDKIRLKKLKEDSDALERLLEKEGIKKCKEIE